MWTLSIWAFLRALNAPVGAVLLRALAAGLVFGFALATKLNALFLPFLFVFWCCSRRREAFASRSNGAPPAGSTFECPPFHWS